MPCAQLVSGCKECFALFEGVQPSGSPINHPLAPHGMDGRASIAHGHRHENRNRDVASKLGQACYGVRDAPGFVRVQVAVVEGPPLKVVTAEHDSQGNAVGIEHPEAIVARIDALRWRKTAFRLS